MRSLKLMAGSAAIAALVTLPAAPASADWHRPHHPDCFILALPFCVAGAVVGAAAMNATAPFVIAGGVVAPAPYPGYYYPPRPYYYPRPAAYYYGPPPGYFRPGPYYGPPPPAGYPVQRPWVRPAAPPPANGYNGPPRD
jgi:hypothetical protein